MKFTHGPFKNETFQSVAVSTSGPKHEWLQKLRKEKTQKLAHYQEQFLQWLGPDNTSLSSSTQFENVASRGTCDKM